MEQYAKEILTAVVMATILLGECYRRLRNDIERDRHERNRALEMVERNDRDLNEMHWRLEQHGL